MQGKTTRAFRTISEAGDELGLQPHVLRFWESKFSDIKPIKRGGGRRFYRPKDIEFIRGIKVLLHEEKQPIREVQKRIRSRGIKEVIKIGQSIQKASRQKEINETELVPERIKMVGEIYVEKSTTFSSTAKLAPLSSKNDGNLIDAKSDIDTSANEDMQSALERLITLRRRWLDFRGNT